MILALMLAMDQAMFKGYIAGLIEGQGCFNISIQKARPIFRMPFEIRAVFLINMNIKEKEMLEKVRKEIGVGDLVVRGKTSANQDKNKGYVRYQVMGLRNCIAFINYLDSIEFLGHKKQTYPLWKKAVYIIFEDRHRTKEGILEIAKIRDSISSYNHKGYRDYHWFKDYLEKHYQDYVPYNYNENEESKKRNEKV